MYRLRRFLQLSSRHRFWLLQLVVLSALAKLAIALIPLRHLARYLGPAQQNIRLCVVATPAQLEKARDIGRLTAIMARITPWQSQCLVQVLAAKTLLAQQQVPWVAHFGVRHEAGHVLKAHAWLTVGPDVIVGRREHRTFAVVATYSPALLFRQPLPCAQTDFQTTK